MSPKPQRVPEYLEHMRVAIDRVTTYTAAMTRDEFARSVMTQDAVIRSLAILGEAVRHIRLADPAFLSMHPGIPWAEIYGFRNRLIHDYFEVDLGAIWSTIQEDLPRLRPQLEAILAGTAPGLPPDRIAEARARYEAEPWWHEAARPDESWASGLN
jgi:uncharacterized protein with HEPN domain